MPLHGTESLLVRLVNNVSLALKAVVLHGGDDVAIDLLVQLFAARLGNASVFVLVLLGIAAD